MLKDPEMRHPDFSAEKKKAGNASNAPPVPKG
jgi:hypothetical protein